jgi:hypothetical protein
LFSAKSGTMVKSGTGPTDCSVAPPHMSGVFCDEGPKKKMITVRHVYAEQGDVRRPQIGNVFAS